MAKAGDDLEKHVDESMPFLFEKLGDLSALRNHGCLTVAQCALLVPAILSSERPGDASEMAAHYLQLALLDIGHGELCPKHPETLLPYSQYLRMAEAGMFSVDCEEMPVANAGWLVSLDEAERWFQSKGAVSVKFDGLKAELAKMNAAAEEAADTSAQEAALAAPVESATPAHAVDRDADEVLAALFDPVRIEALEKMFPASNNWQHWSERAKRNGLDAAREKRGLFNPYRAAMWFLKQGWPGWDMARCNRTLAANLPARSKDQKHLLTGDLD